MLLRLTASAFGQRLEQIDAVENPSTFDSFLEAGMPDEVLFAVRKPSIDGHWYANYVDRYRRGYHHLWSMNPVGTRQMVLDDSQINHGTSLAPKPIPRSPKLGVT